MIKQLIFLSVIYLFSHIYNQCIYPYIIKYIYPEYYNNTLISLLILIQINNFTLFYDLSKKIETESNHSKIEDKYIKTILNQIEYINKREMDFNRKIINFKENYKKIYKSCNDIRQLC